MSSCSSCGGHLSDGCTTVYPSVSPCSCDSPAPIQEIGPEGNKGFDGPPPHFTIGTVSAGAPSVVITESGVVERIINFVLPSVDYDSPWTYTQDQTFQQPSVFNAGLEVTGGPTSIGGNEFDVDSPAAFAGNLELDGILDIAGNSTGGSLDSEGTLMVEGQSNFQDFVVSGDLSFGLNTVWTPALTTEYVAGRVTFDSCKDTRLSPLKGSSPYNKGEATGLLVIAPVDDGPICNPIVINVPISTCTQVTPLIDIEIRVSYQFGSTITFNYFQSNLWLGAIGSGTLIDSLTVGNTVAAGNYPGGEFILRGQAQLAAGNNSFNVEVSNPDATEPWNTVQVTYFTRN